MIIRNKGIILIFLLLALVIHCPAIIGQDSLRVKQELYNGSIWINRFLSVKGDQFLFSRSFLPGSVTMRGKTYPIDLRYDIYEDEIQTIAGHFGILQINKELVDSFTINYENREYRFISVRNDTMPEPLTYYNVLLDGVVSLYVNYQKKVDKMSSGGEGAKFYQVNRIYAVKDNVYSPAGSKTELISVLKGQEENIKSFIKKNHLRINSRDPLSFIPVVRYYNSLTR